jgi:hypothetical protein
MTVSGEALRWLVSKELKITAQGDVYGRKWDTASYESIMDAVLEREYHKNLIYLSIQRGKRVRQKDQHTDGFGTQKSVLPACGSRKNKQGGFQCDGRSQACFFGFIVEGVNMGAEKVKTSGSVMVVGAGIAGMQAALDLANSEYKVYLVEKSASIGGMMSRLDKTFPTNDCAM